MHELAHLLAAHTKKLRGEITIDYRLYFLVLVSRIAGIWKLPRHQRLLIYCTGMGCDCLVAGILVVIVFMSYRHVFTLPMNMKELMKLIIISEYLAVMWQFQIFLKTDVYHIVVDLTDQHDLPDRARFLISTLKNRILSTLKNRIFSKRTKSVTFTGTLEPMTRDKYDWLTVGYTLLYGVGISGSCIWLVFYLIPATFTAITEEFTLLLVSFHAGNVLGILDGLVSLSLEGFSFILLSWLWLKDYLAHKGMKSHT